MRAIAKSFPDLKAILVRVVNRFKLVHQVSFVIFGHLVDSAIFSRSIYYFFLFVSFDHVLEI